MCELDGVMRPTLFTRLKDLFKRENSASLALSPPRILPMVFFGLMTHAGFFMDAVFCNIFCCPFVNLLMRKGTVGDISSLAMQTHSSP